MRPHQKINTVARKDIVKYVPDEVIVNKIYVIRGHKVMLDYDLAALYEVETRRLNEQVKRNLEKFPPEFMFRLRAKEWQIMRSQIATSSTQGIHFQPAKTMRSQIATASQSKRNINVTPYAFTEHGVAMVANVLKSERAVKMSIAVVKTFIQLRKQFLDYTALAEQIKALKLHLDGHDAQLNQIYDAIENLLDKKAEQETWQERRRIGFKQK